ncbi:hypothetical protein PRIC1_000047 [Phytophthora ramorum]
MKVLSPSSAIAIASLSVCVQGHGYISQPKASYEPNTIYTNYNALTTASINAGFNGGKYDGSPTDNAKVFNDHWNATGYKSLREMVDPIAPDYGKSIQTAAPIDVAGYTEMWWQNDEYKEGFIASHSGPCEAWIDDVRIFHHDNCAAQFTSYPAKIPADYASCKGDCLFSFYWLALHEPNWQIYKQCVPITNSGSSTTTQSSASGAEQPTTDAPVATTAAPIATVATPAATKGASAPVPEATPAATTAVPEVAVTEAPEVTTTPTVTIATPEATPAATTGAPEVTVTEAPEATTTPTVTIATPEATKGATATAAPTAPDNCHMY